MHRWLRVLVCLLLICALLINLSPLRAKASGAVATGVAVGVAVAIGVAAIMNAAGVHQGVDYSTFNEIVGNCVDALSPEWAVDGMVTFLALSSGSVTKTYASRNFLQAVLDWMFGEGEVLTTATAPELINCTRTIDQEALGKCSEHSYYYYVASSSADNYFHCGYADYPLEIFNDGTAVRTVDNVGGVQFFNSKLGWDFSSGGVTGFSSISLFVEGSLVHGITTDKDLTLESVGQDVDTDYKTYVDTGIVDEDGIPYVPVTIPSLGTDTFVDQSQAEAQAGTTAQEIIDQLVDAESVPGTDSGTITVPETVTLKDILTGILSVPKSIAQAISAFFADVVAAVKAIPAAIADIFTPSADMDHFSISLSDYFPFCIPFDLYDFFACLNADPVAPVIDWEIPLPGGTTYPVQVDLSAWDEVAQLLRRLQLLLFCVGLAFKTRDLIKG